MNQSTIHDFPDYSLQLRPHRAWSIGSAIASMAAIMVSTVAFAVHQAGIGETVLLIPIATLMFVAVVHARFLSFARFQSRQTSELVLTREREFESMFKNALDAILVLDDQGVCRNANPSASIFFSVRRDRIIGQSVCSLFADTGAFNSMWSQLRADRKYQGEAELVRADGATVVAEFNAAAEFLPNRHLVILRDITPRRRAQQMVKQSLMLARSSWQEAETLRKAFLALTEDLRMNSVLDALLQTLSQFVPYERAQLFLLETDRRLFLAHETLNRIKPTSDNAFPEALYVSEFPILETVLTTREGLAFEDLANERNGSHLGKSSSVRSWIGVPIVSSNQVLGLLSLTHSNPAQFSSSHLALVRALATPAAVAIQNARLYERVEICGAELEQRIAELREFEETMRTSGKAPGESDARFQKIFRSVPTAISLSSLSDGTFIETNKLFEQRFGSTRLETEIALWEDPCERAKLLDRLGHGAKVRGAVARLRNRSGSFKETTYSAELIDLDGQQCLVLVAEDQTGSPAYN